jgi:ABC-type polysaccharide/polyol phosphate transport system ATPase subunit
LRAHRAWSGRATRATSAAAGPNGSRDHGAVVASNVGKTYRLGEHQSLPNTLASTFRWKRSHRPRFEALHEVSFTIERGECFGIVGPNGSGKSTVAQIVSGITLPTEGWMVVRGRVLPLLAVGSGFHPELTGIENVVLFGTMIGLPRRVITSRIDDIGAFSELTRHMDTPIKRYSDGMQARLSFAVAMLFPADVYLFDEVLAVVDGEFRARCLRAIQELVAAGRTVIFVSHANEDVAMLCDRVMWLQDGQLRQIGPTAQVLAAYSGRTGD